MKTLSFTFGIIAFMSGYILCCLWLYLYGENSKKDYKVSYLVVQENNNKEIP